MDEVYWKQRVEFLEVRALESARECARQHVALGQLLDVVGDALAAPEHAQALDLLARFEAILQPYCQWIQKYHRAEWALKDRAPTHPIVEDVPG